MKLPRAQLFDDGETSRPPSHDALITPRLRNANFLQNPMADVIPVELERFLAVRDWARKNQPD